MKTTSMRLLSLFVLVIIALGIMAACLSPAPTPVVLDSQAAKAQEDFKTIVVKGLSDLRGPVTMGGAAAMNGGAAITGSLTISGFTQYPIAYFGTDAVNGTMVAHGMRGAPTYPSCMVYNAGFVTATVQISSSNATSVTFRMFDTSGNPWTTPALAVRCSAVYVP